MRIATYNFNNLFKRVKAFELAKPSDSKPILEAFNKAVSIIGKDTYTAADKTFLGKTIKQYVETTDEKTQIIIQQVRGKLYTKPTTGANKGQIVIKANGRGEWVGWLELVTEDVTDKATINTATVVHNADADILCCVEIEDRTSLQKFNKNLLDKHYAYSMLIDGNDERGIDVGVLSKHAITHIETHIFDTYKDQQNRSQNIFSRDCAIYSIQYKTHTIHLLCNHFKSKIGGGAEKRQKQADKVVEILKRFDLKTEFVVVAGDLNAKPDEPELQKLLGVKNLHNIVQEELPEGERSTYQNIKDEQIDYLLISSALKAKLTNVGIDKSGIFKARNPDRMAEVTDITTAASDHAMVYADFNL